MTTTSQERIDTRVPGVALIASSVLAVMAMTHHPAPASDDFAAWARNVERIAAVNQAVHGAIIALVGVLTWALTVFAIRRGVHRSLVSLGLVAWAIGAGSMIIAPVLNGFVVTHIARQAVASPERIDLLRMVLQAMLAADRVIAVIGALAMSAAIVSWSADLTSAAGGARRVGLFGSAAGLVPLAALSTGLIHLDVHGMTLVLIAWTVWLVAIGVLMIQRNV